MNISKKKIIFTIILIFLILFSFGMINSYGFDVNDLKGEKFNSPSATNFANQLITVLSVIGSVLSVIVLIALGIKYMMGSVEEKATYKKSLMPYVIGAALVFAASAIAGIFYNIIVNM